MGAVETEKDTQTHTHRHKHTKREKERERERERENRGLEHLERGVEGNGEREETRGRGQN